MLSWLLIVAGALAAVIAVWLLSSGPRVASYRLRADRTRVGIVTRLGEKATALVQKALTGRDSWLVNMLTLASVQMRPVEFVIWVVIAVVVSASVGALASGLPMAVMLPLLCLVAAYGLLRFRIGRRVSQFEKQMTETLQILAGALRSGHSLPAALKVVSEEVPSPAGEEFARAINEVRIGADLETALAGVAERTRSEEMRTVVRAIAINTEVGGGLSDVMDKVAGAITARNELRATVRTQSSEGKMSAYILTALPLVIAGAISAMSPGYMDPLFTTPLGWLSLAVAAVMLIAGGLWMRKLINIKY